MKIFLERKKVKLTKVLERKIKSGREIIAKVLEKNYRKLKRMKRKERINFFFSQNLNTKIYMLNKKNDFLNV